MKNKKILAVIVIMACMSLLLCACTSAKEPSIKVGNDVIPTLYSAVGERSISGTSKGFENDVNYLTLTYGSGVVSEDDLKEYMNLLLNQEGFLYTQDSKVENNTLILQLGKASEDDGKIVLIDVQFPQSGSLVIKYAVGAGTITPY